MITFKDLDYADRERVQAFTLGAECRNCDYNFVNLMSWRFLYGTQVAEHRGMLILPIKPKPWASNMPPYCSIWWPMPKRKDKPFA